MFCEVVASGACCHMICHPGKPFVRTIATGDWMELGSTFTEHFAKSCVPRKVVRRKPAQRFWIARVSRRPKKGSSWLRFRQESKRQKASFARRYAWFGAGGASSACQPAGSRWSQATACTAHRQQALETAKNLGGWQLSWRRI